MLRLGTAPLQHRCYCRQIGPLEVKQSIAFMLDRHALKDDDDDDNDVTHLLDTPVHDRTAGAKQRLVTAPHHGSYFQQY